MTRRDWLKTAAALPALSAAQGKQPNVLLIMTDDQGWFDLGVHGNPHISTPNIDRLASEGVRFTHFYCSPVCSPTRAALMTGRHYQRTGAIDTFMGRDTLDPSEITMGQVFQKAGYRTGCVGKWHLGRYMRYHPNERGFNEYFGFWQYGFMNRYDDSDELWEGKQPVEVNGYITDALTDRAIRFVRDHRSRPYFLYVPYNAPHSPFLVPDKYIEPYLSKGLPLKDARIYGMVTSIDENVGRLLKEVDAANTIVIFMTDNGGVSGFYKAGLRAGKGTCYEGGIRAPFIVRWSGKLPAGAVVDAMGQHIDVLPTLCELTGVALPQDRKLDGRSLAAILRDGKGESPHEFIYSQWNRVRPILNDTPDMKASWSIRDSRGVKLNAQGELFDLRSDPSEKNNISASHPMEVKKLRTEFERWFADVTNRDYSRVPIEIGRPDESPVEIDLTWGDPVGKVRPQYRSYNGDTIDDWSSVQDYVSWKVDVVTPGDYELSLAYGCEPSDAGSKARISLAGAAIDYTFSATPGRMVWQTRSAGRMRLRGGPSTLEIKPLQIPGKELAAIHKIWLRKV